MARYFLALALLGMASLTTLLRRPIASAGFEVTRVAGADLTSYPMMGTVDDRGRLFLAESSGHTLLQIGYQAPATGHTIPTIAYC